jgi:hypothetical protein
LRKKFFVGVFLLIPKGLFSGTEKLSTLENNFQGFAQLTVATQKVVLLKQNSENG